MKYKKKVSGSSEIGIVITAFFILLIIVMPIYLMIQEYALFNNFNQELEAEVEFALMNQLMYLNSNAFSEARFVLNSDYLNRFALDIESDAPLNKMTQIENLEITFKTIASSADIMVSFNYDYVSQIIMRGHLTKKMNVKLRYQLPVNQ
ncbi:MAG: hypothetical protein BGO41_09510 [Clostridiales bacterium 38-18]|nr:MAG: hypothetical protein BGO41_09510 [Clostridiales bacterium 38-18]